VGYTFDGINKVAMRQRLKNDIPFLRDIAAVIVKNWDACDQKRELFPEVECQERKNKKHRPKPDFLSAIRWQQTHHKSP
jgi:hypothetical protein